MLNPSPRSPKNGQPRYLRHRNYFPTCGDNMGISWSLRFENAETGERLCISIDKYFYMCYYIFVRRNYYMKSYSSREVLKILKADGWYEVNCVGSHHQFKHPTKKGRVTIKHPDKDIPRKTLDSIERQSGLLFR